MKTRQLEVERVVPNALGGRHAVRFGKKRLGDKPLHLGACLWLSIAIASAGETVRLSGRAMGTTWSVTFVQPEKVLDSQDALRRIAGRLEELEQHFSTYRANSELSRFNSATDLKWVPVSPELARIAAESRRISALTGGAFDVTVGPLVRLWGFGPQRRPGTLPADGDIEAARETVDWQKLEARAEPAALRKHSPTLAADFSSIAKGFSADALSELLNSLHASDHFVQIGGDVRTGGHAARGEPWRSGIESPEDPTRESRLLELIVPLTGRALSTSGDYRNFFTVEGRRYGHIIDPRTGRPAASALASVSVVAASCADSSALATGLFVLGPEEGWNLAVQHRLAAVFFVREETGTGFVRRMTPEFERVVGRAKEDFPSAGLR
ncbi:MAG TPA: FAD:protein FMN transferase [Opitutaceae bacterium]|nr:FAD:protein FMN transferase [Opitutaceae bacterium]